MTWLDKKQRDFPRKRWLYIPPALLLSGLVSTLIWTAPSNRPFAALAGFIGVGALAAAFGWYWVQLFGIRLYEWGVQQPGLTGWKTIRWADVETTRWDPTFQWLELVTPELTLTLNLAQFQRGYEVLQWIGERMAATNPRCQPRQVRE